MRGNAPERFSVERDLLHQLITLLPPSLLAAQGATACSAGVHVEPWGAQTAESMVDLQSSLAAVSIIHVMASGN